MRIMPIPTLQHTRLPIWSNVHLLKVCALCTFCAALFTYSQSAHAAAAMTQQGLEQRRLKKRSRQCGQSTASPSLAQPFNGTSVDATTPEVCLQRRLLAVLTPSTMAVRLRARKGL